MRHAPLRAALLALPLLAAACASPGDGLSQREKALAERDMQLPPSSELVPVSQAGPGLYLAELDARLRAWNAFKASTSERDEPKLRMVEQELAIFTRQRSATLIEELQTGPPRHRRIAALGLGFSGDPNTLGALLAALEDPDSEVVDNALAGLGQLADPTTPLAPVLDRLRYGPDPNTRRNAAYATLRILAAGGSDPGAFEVCRLALYDSEPSVRVQAAACLGNLLDDEALSMLSDGLDDDIDLVAVACGRAMVHIGTEVPTAKGEAARLLVDAAVEAKSRRREMLRLELMRLAGVDRGPDIQRDWMEWAYRLP